MIPVRETSLKEIGGEVEGKEEEKRGLEASDRISERRSGGNS